MESVKKDQVGGLREYRAHSEQVQHKRSAHLRNPRANAECQEDYFQSIITVEDLQNHSWASWTSYDPKGRDQDPR